MRRWLIANLLGALILTTCTASAAVAQIIAGEAPLAELLPPLEPEAPIETAPDVGPVDQAVPSAAPDAALTPPLTLSPDGPVAPVNPSDGLIVPLDASDAADAAAAVATIPSPTSLGETIGYDTATGATTWIIAHDNRFGWVDLESFPTLPRGYRRGLVTGLGFHFLDGPVVTDMPSKLFDFSIGYQWRQWIWQNVGVDVVARVGAFSDFETTAREGVRYPSHAVAFCRWTPACHLLLGVDVLDRDDISLLPVFGAVWKPYDDLQLDAVFPRPAAAVRLGASDAWAYVRGQLGGGTWAIERASGVPDNATYRDLRLAFGVETRSPDAPLQSSLELGYVFVRELTYSSGVGDLDLEDAVMLSLNNQY